MCFRVRVRVSPTDGAGNPVGVMYTVDKEELLDSERSAQMRVSVSVITDEASCYYQDA